MDRERPWPDCSTPFGACLAQNWHFVAHRLSSLMTESEWPSLHDRASTAGSRIVSSRCRIGVQECRPVPVPADPGALDSTRKPVFFTSRAVTGQAAIRLLGRSAPSQANLPNIAWQNCCPFRPTSTSQVQHLPVSAPVSAPASAPCASRRPKPQFTPTRGRRERAPTRGGQGGCSPKPHQGSHFFAFGT